MRAEAITLVGRPDRRTLIPFLMAAVGWWIAASAICLYFTHSREMFFPALSWMTKFWVLCLLDIYALARTVGAALSLVTEAGEKRGALLIQAFYWGSIKLACLGILVAILLQGKAIPALGLLMGTATLVVVPLVGGYGWSQKVLRYA